MTEAIPSFFRSPIHRVATCLRQNARRIFLAASLMPAALTPACHRHMGDRQEIGSPESDGEETEHAADTDTPDTDTSQVTLSDSGEGSWGSTGEDFMCDNIEEPKEDEPCTRQIASVDSWVEDSNGNAWYCCDVLEQCQGDENDCSKSLKCADEHPARPTFGCYIGGTNDAPNGWERLILDCALEAGIPNQCKALS